MTLATCHLHAVIYCECLHILRYGTREDTLDTLLSLEVLECLKEICSGDVF